jgi:hypothetical protein
MSDFPAYLDISLEQGVDSWRASCVVTEDDFYYQYHVSAETPDKCLAELMESVRQKKWDCKFPNHTVKWSGLEE